MEISINMENIKSIKRKQNFCLIPPYKTGHFYMVAMIYTDTTHTNTSICPSI